MTLARWALPLAIIAMPLHAAPAQVAGEIPLHIEATGAAVPDGALALVRIEGHGLTRAEAIAALDAPRAELNRVLGELGVSDKDRIKLPETAEVGTMTDVVAVPSIDCAPKKCKSRKGQEPMVPPPQAQFSTSEEWQVTLRQPFAMTRLSAIESESLHVIPMDGPATFYSDPAKSRDEAVAKAIATARAEADRYAAALGYKVLRIERVSNTKPALNLPDIVSTFAMMDKRATREAFFQQGSMTVGVAIDFVIAPK